jgi:hypothetical protein
MKFNQFVLLTALFIFPLPGWVDAQQTDCLTKLEKWNQIDKNEPKPVPPSGKMKEYEQCVSEIEKARLALLTELTSNPEKRVKETEKEVAALQKDSSKAAGIHQSAKRDSTHVTKEKPDSNSFSKLLTLKRDSIGRIKSGMQKVKLYTDVLSDSYKRLMNQYDREEEDVKKANYKAKLNELDE